ncbi:DNA polymerase II small subunit [Methanocalculus alkaliphilus]|uniref:DNA-directed DNA polymerase II small subunit n=1 Tax=Methanocalculus alkaliphilus TaxID=768730 RepID=UPI0020A01950|nr:DNA-directed DNA polymerase II small subunit [Methanocalculus alkaliphilus]MCP1716284.1 DNA polymerase II small subunit [Methanocalculus alkaliphilus]
MLRDQEIVARFCEAGHLVDPTVVSYIQEKGDSSLIQAILQSLSADCPVVLPSHIPSLTQRRDGMRFTADPILEVIEGMEGSAGPVRQIEDYASLFRNRYDTLGSLIRKRTGSIPVEALIRSSRFRDSDVTIIGIVLDVKTTAKGHRIVELEDPTGIIPVLFNNSREGFADAERIVPDEVIGVRGKLSPDAGLFYADQLLMPDIPIQHAPYTPHQSGKAVFISDIHIGSDTFLEEPWERFCDWISAEDDISYLLVAGDLVDGIGIYPGQEKELTIPNIYEQYDRLGEMLATLPSRLRIVLAPGNHDVVRGAEPQPAIPVEFRSAFTPNCTFVENPSAVSIHGVRVLMYHGRSIDDLISLIPGARYEAPSELMEAMLKRRHLAPSYGRRTPVLATEQDRLIIDPVPEILHTGHVHITGISRYRGVLSVNAGAWQGQTAFQKQMNINPTPGQAVIIDLERMEPQVCDFLSG